MKQMLYTYRSIQNDAKPTRAKQQDEDMKA